MSSRLHGFLLVSAALPTLSATTGVLVHGYHCEAHGWEKVVWGDVHSQQLGRLPQAALLAWEMRHELEAFICGTGASRDAAGTLEADAALAMLFARLPTLHEFAAFDSVDLTELEAVLRRTVVADTTSVNTAQEVRYGLELLQQRDVHRAVLVSSPTHMPRCLRDACEVARQLGFDGRIVACPCDTSWTAQSPIVVEPPHRPDASGDADGASTETSFYELVRRASTMAYADRGSEAKGATNATRSRDFLDALGGWLGAFEEESRS